MAVMTRFVAPGLILMVLGVTGCAPSSDPSRPVVGTQTLLIRDEARQRDIATEIWFEATAGSRVEGFSPLPPLRSIDIAQNAEPVDGAAKRPLIVMSHGNWGTRYSQGWLATRLVRDGYVVVSVSHPGTMNGDQSVAGRYRLWDRAMDVSLVLDHTLRSPRWSALVDEQRIGFVGHSFGGWTGVSLAGGRFDPDRQRRFCLDHGRDFYCRGTAEDDTSALDKEDAARSYRDERIKAFYIMASGPAQGFDRESLRSIQVPFLVDSALQDDVLGMQENSSVFAQAIPSAGEVQRDVGHFAYVPECRILLGSLLAPQICADPPGVDRAKAHQGIYSTVKAFFARELRLEIDRG